MTTRIVELAAITAFAAFSVATPSFAQEPVSPQIGSNPGVESRTEATIDDALFQAKSGTTIPMTNYSFSGSRGTYKGVLVGGDPFNNPQPVTINAVLIPLIFLIFDSNGTLVTFDPTVADSCDAGVPTSDFLFSPLGLPTNLTFNGVSVGNAQYIDGFMRAEFWNRTGGSSSYSNFINWIPATPVYFPLGPGTVGSTGTDCTEQQGVISESLFESTMTSLIIPGLQAAGVISPTQFAFFLTHNVVTSGSSGNIEGGKHYHTGSPVQTWARAPYNAVFDVELASHEIGEWMNDPLGSNATPAWGHIGETKTGCASNFEVGDSLNGTAVVLSGALGGTYHLQELAFFSWFYDDKSATSVGAGDKFSSNGTFTLPSKPCPPGGSYQPLTSATTSPLPNGATTIHYASGLLAHGGIEPYSWSVTSGALPKGLKLSSGGTISGTPTTAGTYNFTVKATDSSTPIAQSATQALSLTIPH